MAAYESELLTGPLRSSRSIQEFRIDFFLEEEFAVDINFVRAFMAAACKDLPSVKCVEYVSHSVSDKYGEADLVVLTTAALPSGRAVKSALLIEDKINAGFQPSQPQRYRQRGEEGVSSGCWDSFVTVLVAPAAYITRSHGFDAAVSLEQISEWICPHDAERRAFKVGKIKEAIKKQGAHGVQTVDYDMTAFRIAYYGYLQTFNSQRGTDFTMRAPTPTYWGDNWFVLKSPSLPIWVQLRHMAQTGNIEVNFNDVQFAKCDRLAEFLEGDMVLIPTGKYKQHVTVRLATPQIPKFDSFERDRPKVEAALLSAERLWRLYLKKRTEFEAILVPSRRISGVASTHESIQKTSVPPMTEEELRRLAQQRISTSKECGFVALKSALSDDVESVDAPVGARDSQPLQGNGPREITRADVVAEASKTAFGKPLVTNILRAMIVEAIVAKGLSAGWEYCAADWSGWDFQSTDGIKLEVKQSAARQSWATEASPPTKCSFDIAPRIGYFEGVVWRQFPEPTRIAHIYVFAYHPGTDLSADHRDPRQWRFYVVPALRLPENAKTISLSRIQNLKLARKIGFEELAGCVEGVKASLSNGRRW